MRKTFLFLLLVIIGLTSCDSWLSITFVIVNDTNEEATIHECWSTYTATMEDVLPTETHDSAYYAKKEIIEEDTVYTIESHKSVSLTYDLGVGGWNDKISENFHFEGGYIIPMWESIQDIVIGNDTLPKTDFQDRKKWSFSDDGTWTLHLKHSAE